MPVSTLGCEDDNHWSLGMKLPLCFIYVYYVSELVHEVNKYFGRAASFEMWYIINMSAIDMGYRLRCACFVNTSSQSFCNIILHTNFFYPTFSAYCGCWWEGSGAMPKAQWKTTGKVIVKLLNCHLIFDCHPLELTQQFEFPFSVTKVLTYSCFHA